MLPRIASRSPTLAMELTSSVVKRTLNFSSLRMMRLTGLKESQPGTSAAVMSRRSAKSLWLNSVRKMLVSRSNCVASMLLSLSGFADLREMIDTLRRGLLIVVPGLGLGGGIPCAELEPQVLIQVSD